MLLFGVAKGDKFLEKLLNYYDNLNFNDYTDNLFTLAIPKIITMLAKKEGYTGKHFPERLSNGTIIYSKKVLSTKINLGQFLQLQKIHILFIIMKVLGEAQFKFIEVN